MVVWEPRTLPADPRFVSARSTGGGLPLPLLLLSLPSVMIMLMMVVAARRGAPLLYHY